MTDLEERAARVKAIVEGNFGKVLGRKGNVVRVEVPADVSIGLMWGGGLTALVVGQSTKLAPARVRDAHGNIIVCHGHDVTTAFYRIDVHLTPPQSDTGAAPTPESITTKPHG